MRELLVWIIEDKDLEKAVAEKILNRLAQPGSLRLDIKSSSSFEWPPIFDNQRQSRHIKLPDLVVLDLFDDGKLKGDAFYKRLRDEEKKKEKLFQARVIVWSGYWSDGRAAEFVKETFTTDPRFMRTETKDIFSLEDAVKGCLSQIEEEQSVADGY